MCLLSFVPEKPPKRVAHKMEDTKTIQSLSWKETIGVVAADARILGLFSLVIVMGYTMGFVENFCYINMRQIYEKHGQSIGRDITICRVFLSIGGIISWFFSGSLGKRFGPDNIMLIAIFCLPFSLWLYSGGVAPEELNTWTTTGFFLAESIRSGVYATLWSTATVRLNELCPKSQATMQSLMESTYRGIGHTSGAFFGGILCKKYGTISEAFLVAGKGLLTFLLAITTMFYTLSNKELVTLQQN